MNISPSLILIIHSSEHMIHWSKFSKLFHSSQSLRFHSLETTIHSSRIFNTHYQKLLESLIKSSQIHSSKETSTPITNNFFSVFKTLWVTLHKLSEPLPSIHHSLPSIYTIISAPLQWNSQFFNLSRKHVRNSSTQKEEKKLKTGKIEERKIRGIHYLSHRIRASIW